MIDVKKAVQYINDPVRPQTESLRRLLEEAWHKGYDAGDDDAMAHERGITLDELNQHTPNPYRKKG